MHEAQRRGFAACMTAHADADVQSVAPDGH
jgi:hypothetical protein